MSMPLSKAKKVPSLATKPKASTSFEIEGKTFAPGTMTRLTIPLAQLYIQTSLELIVVVLQGVEPGPRLMVSAAIHGDEINGIFSIKKILNAVDPKKLKGTLVLVPIVNIFGVIHQTRYLPDRRDLNRCFPGAAKGSLASNLAHTFMKKIVRHVTHMVDLHTAAIHRNNWPQIRANLDDPETLRLARAFGAPLIIHSNERDGSLRQAGTSKGIPRLLFEGGAALRRNPDSVEAGATGTLRVMKALGMYEPKITAPAKKCLESRKSTWVRAEKSGFFAPEVEFGQRVKEGESMGQVILRLHTDFGSEHELPVTSPFDGVAIGITENPMVYQGDALIHVAKLD